jgi:polyferredoxin
MLNDKPKGEPIAFINPTDPSQPLNFTTLPDPLQIKSQPAAITLPYNLLENKWFGGFMRSSWYPTIFQWGVLVGFAFITYQLLFGPTLAHSNVGTALTWVFWWPLIPIMFVFLGRFWCTLCPFGTLSDLVQKFVGNNRPVPKFLKNYGIWIIDATFILITWSDHVWGVVESPVGSGILMLLIASGVIFSGAFWERRTFCRHLCFLGGLSGNYARVGMLALRATPSVCATCKVSACYKGTSEGPGCPMFEFTRTMDTSANCTLCANCIKNCPNDSIRLTVRMPREELWFIRKPKAAESFLAMVIMGIVFVQNITMLEVWQELLHNLEQITGTTSYYVNFTLTFLMAMALPIGLLAITSFIAQRLNGDTFKGNFAKYGYAIIPLDVAGHIAHNLFHLLAEGKAVLFTGMALFGVSSHGQSTALVSTDVIQILQYILIVVGVFGSMYTAYRISQSNYAPASRWLNFAPYAALIIILGIINFGLFMLPMAMRM